MASCGADSERVCWMEPAGIGGLSAKGQALALPAEGSPARGGGPCAPRLRAFFLRGAPRAPPLRLFLARGRPLALPRLKALSCEGLAPRAPRLRARDSTLQSRLAFARYDDVLAAPHLVLTADSHGNHLDLLPRLEERLDVLFDGLSHFDVVLWQFFRRAAQGVLLLRMVKRVRLAPMGAMQQMQAKLVVSALRWRRPSGAVRNRLLLPRLRVYR